MNAEELLTRSFQVGDALDAGCRGTLASACQRLDIAPARPSLSRAEFARVDAARRQAQQEGLNITWELVEPSHYDVQVLAVLMRLLIEVDGASGAKHVLQLATKALTEAWNGLTEARLKLPAADQEKTLRKWGRYFDTVFEQLYSWLSREQERDIQALRVALAADESPWKEWVPKFEQALERVALRVSSWSKASELLLDLSEHQVAPAADSEAARNSDVERALVAGETSAVSSASTAGDVGAPSETAEVLAPASGARALSGFDSDSAVLQVSTRFWELQHSMNALQTLLKQGEFEKASIVALDLQSRLANFDVASYFPGLFAGFFELSANYAEPLSRFHNGSSVRNVALTQLYRTDLPRFLKLAVQGHG